MQKATFFPGFPYSRPVIGVHSILGISHCSMPDSATTSLNQASRSCTIYLLVALFCTPILLCQDKSAHVLASHAPSALVTSSSSSTASRPLLGSAGPLPFESTGSSSPYHATKAMPTIPVRQLNTKATIPRGVKLMAVSRLMMTESKAPRCYSPFR